ncbi:glycoside hydrolase family 76 protein [Curtobacterium sp. MCSS17_015]|uniref:glycoside hydrolase family 76 protein n=1 Tax=Curtobacterium sp. MCSS17_015 TaxID=2175666 RepID=UPI000DA94713|nr:glycoside hydrolase family 76 protein [Curtobacterium sp. MCSS17_015]WIB26595.1 glycoside hydrolase family 76 protein [Curtobacterium sp. MCSS17_015]
MLSSARARSTRGVRIAATAVVLGVVAAGVPQVAEVAEAAPDAVWQQRASATYDAMQDHLYTGAAGHGLYRENTDTSSGNPYSYLWEYREATQAALDLQGIAGVGPAYANSAAARVDGFELYHAVKPGGRAGYESYLPAPIGTGGDVYYDDNAVVGLSLISQYQATSDPEYLDRARGAFDIAARGWNADAALTCPGGSDWIDRADNTTRGANVTGLSAQLAAHLYEETGESSYLRWSTKAYNWNNKCLKESAGLYRNSINDDGTVDPTLWTYNSGAMIGTATILFRATEDPKYLQQATSAARASLRYWTAENRLQQQPAVFNAFYFKDLLLLDSVQHDPSYRAAIEQYATATWRDNRDADTGLFHFQPSGGGDPAWDRPAATLDQAAMVQVFAVLGWSADRLGQVS